HITEQHFHIDEDLFFRVLFNLIRNAHAAGAETVEFSQFTKGDFFYITIEDDGRGIDDAMRDKIFQPFVSRNTKKGLGLGLPIARELMQVMEGDLYLAPQNHPTRLKGACFFLSIKKQPTQEDIP
ncbi:MAG: ATP-binding protein, partial [Pseudomonadota bacterium]